MPAYSLDLSPIEVAFSKLKTFIRRCRRQTIPDLMRAIPQGLGNITAWNAKGWIAHAGFSAKAQFIPQFLQGSIMKHSQDWRIIMALMRLLSSILLGVILLPLYGLPPKLSGQIAFIADNHKGLWELYIVNADGTGKHLVTEVPRPGGDAPVWSPDGIHLAFTADNSADSYVSSITTIESDGSGLRNLTGKGCCYFSASWSPDGKYLTFYHDASSGGNRAVYIDIVNADGTNHHQIFPTNDHSLYETAGTLPPTWSPDGQHIMLIGQRFDQASQGYTDRGIYVVNVDGTNLHHLQLQDIFVDFPTWSPNGKEIAFMGLSHSAQWYLYIVNADGTNVRQLARSMGNALPMWSPDGTKLAFGIDRGNGNSDISIINADGTGLHQLTDGPWGNGYPFWSPDGNHIAYTQGLPTSDGLDVNYSIFIISIDGENKHQLMESSSSEFVTGWSKGQVF